MYVVSASHFGLVFSFSIEWLAYDDHSGLDSVYWKLYDKYSGTVVLHGHEDIIAQGETSVKNKLICYLSLMSVNSL
jgi:extradiol dioxygenase family protein